MDPLIGLILKHARFRECDMAAFIAPHLGPWQRAHASTTGEIRRTSRPFENAFPHGEISPPTLLHAELCGEVSFVSRRAALPEFGGSRQPLDRQVRYYSECAQEASRLFSTSVSRVEERCYAQNPLITPKRHSPVEWRLGILYRSLASRNKCGGSCPPIAVFPAGFPSRGPLDGGGSCRVLHVLMLPIFFLAACHITGTL